MKKLWNSKKGTKFSTWLYTDAFTKPYFRLYFTENDGNVTFKSLINKWNYGKAEYIDVLIYNRLHIPDVLQPLCEFSSKPPEIFSKVLQ